MDNSNYIQQQFSSHWISKYLQPDEVNLLLDKTTRITYRKRETIVKKGEFATHLVLLLSGFVKIEDDEGKKNFILDIVNGFNFVGLPLVLTSEKYMFSIVSLSDSEVVFIPMDVAKSILSSNSKLAFAFIEYGNNSFVMPLLDKLKSASHNNIRGRLAKLILHLSTHTHQSRNFSLLISRFEIAQMIGFSRENVIRMLTEFHSEGIIRINGKSIELLDLSRLEDLAKYS
jgi:CRP/FNR family transcriptional regulator, polysaccharide utilization system transcription regulator